MIGAVDWLLGLGGKALDPAYGAAYYLRRAAALHPEMYVPAPYDYKQVDIVAQEIRKYDKDVLLFPGGDSCGANWMTDLLTLIYPRKVAYAALVQPSIYCNSGCPPYPDNVAVIDIFYTDWWRSIIPGLGVFKPPPASWAPTDKKLVKYPGRYIVNNGKTVVRYIYAPYTHPGDDSTAVQNIMLAQIQKILDLRQSHSVEDTILKMQAVIHDAPLPTQTPPLQPGIGS
jgi:hypothetical protein